MTRLVAVSILLLALPGVVTAQENELGSRVRPRVESGLRSPDESAVAARRFARCLVQKRSGSALRLLAATSEAEFSLYDGVLSKEVSCSSLISSVMQQSGQSIAMSRDVYRGNVAEALLDMAGKLPLPPALPLQRQYSSPWTEVSGRNVVVEEMGVCLAATRPAEIAAVLATEPASREEIAALRVMAPMFGECLSASAKLTANRQSMRATMAEALYHRIMAPATAVSPGQ